MNSSLLYRMLPALLAGAGLTLGGARGSAAVMYSVLDLGTLGGSTATGFAINNSGQVTGTSATATGLSHAFLYSGGVLTDLGTLGGNTSQGNAINDAGQITGFADTGVGTASHAFFYSGGALTDLGTLGGASSSGLGINSSGQIAGFSDMTNGKKHGFRYFSGAKIDLGTLGASDQVLAQGINEAGQIAGFYLAGGATSRAFSYSGSGPLTDLGTLGGSTAAAFAINNSGQITGYSRLAGDNTRHAFLYSGGAMTDLSSLGGDSTGRALNGLGQVVGFSFGADGVQKAFLAASGAISDLNTLIAPTLSLSNALGINDLGQIVAASQAGRAYVLTPANITAAGSHAISLPMALSSSFSASLAAITDSLTVSGVISENLAGETVTKSGLGTLTLSGANSYTGATIVNAGILNLRSNTGLGTPTGGTTVAAGATLQLQGGIAVGAEALVLNGSAAGGQPGALVNLSGTNSYGGAVTVLADTTIASLTDAVLNLSGGIVKHSAMLIFAGGGTVNINSAGISSDSLDSALVDDAAAVNFGAASSYTGATVVRNGGKLTAAVAGALSATSAIQVQSGTLLIAVSNAVNASPITLGDAAGHTSGVLRLGSNAVLGVAQTFGSLTLTNDSTIDLGSLAGHGNTLRFADLSLAGHVLSIFGWTASLFGGGADAGSDTAQDRLLFGAAVSATDLASIRFYNDSGVLLGNGAQITYSGAGGGYEIVPLPELPVTAWAGAGALLALIGFRERRRCGTRLRSRAARPGGSAKCHEAASEGQP